MAEEFVRPVFKGGRFEGGRMPVESLPELAAYQRLVMAVAKHPFKVRNGRQRGSCRLRTGASIVCRALRGREPLWW